MRKLYDAVSSGDILAVTKVLAEVPKEEISQFCSFSQMVSVHTLKFMEDEITPLHLAVIKGNVEIFELLLQHDANIHEKTKKGKSVLLLAEMFQCTNKEFLDGLLLKGAQANEIISKKGTVLHIAVKDGRGLVIEALSQTNAINIQDKYGNTPLHIEARWNGYFITVLLASGATASLNVENNCGDTPLHMAVWHGVDSVVTELIDAGAKMDIPNDQKETPFTLAQRLHEECAANPYLWRKALLYKKVVDVMEPRLSPKQKEDAPLFRFLNMLTRISKEIENIVETPMTQSAMGTSLGKSSNLAKQNKENKWIIEALQMLTRLKAQANEITNQSDLTTSPSESSNIAKQNEKSNRFIEVMQMLTRLEIKAKEIVRQSTLQVSLYNSSNITPKAEENTPGIEALPNEEDTLLSIMLMLAKYEAEMKKKENECMVEQDKSVMESSPSMEKKEIGKKESIVPTLVSQSAIYVAPDRDRTIPQQRLGEENMQTTHSNKGPYSP